MSYDLVVSEHGDLIMSSNRDLAGVSGADLIEQRIKIRLRMHRGSWFYDLNDTLGSMLYQIIGNHPESSLQVDSRVREALQPMDEISIEEINWRYDEDGKSLIILLTYDIATEGEELSTALGEQETQITIPLMAGR